MIPMSQYSLTQLENLAKDQDNAIALELIARLDGFLTGSDGKRPNEIPTEYEVEHLKQEAYNEGFDQGRTEGEEEGCEMGKQEILDKVRMYLFNQDFTEENIETFINEVLGE